MHHSQAFYGNRTGTEIRRENIDRFILGYQTDDFDVTEAIDRTVIHLPGSDNLVLVYNKYQEEERLKVKERAFREDNYVIKPLAAILELDIEIYSRCIVCRMNADGVFESLAEAISRYGTAILRIDGATHHQATLHCIKLCSICQGAVAQVLFALVRQPLFYFACYSFHFAYPAIGKHGFPFQLLS